MFLLEILYKIVWGLPLIIGVVGTGLFFTFALKGLQFRYLKYAIGLALSDNSKSGQTGDISRFQALMTALAATIGIGNIAGVATAITVGGVGALFWMCVTALIGMATIYAEALLAIKFRQLDDRNEMSGGPMYFIQNGLKWRWLSMAFALFGAIAAFGGGNMLQANSVADAMHTVFHVSPMITGLVLFAVVGLTLLGGIKSIGRTASFLVPLMAMVYLCGAAIILLFSFDKIPSALIEIICSAFQGQAAIGGFLGSSVANALRTGVSRGLMTSEAGLGTASIAAAAAKTDFPARQAMVQMTGGFLATVIMCTVTGLVLVTTGVLGQVDAEGRLITGASLTVKAFTSIIPWGGEIVAISICLFATTTLLGWAYYGEKCCEYLFGGRAVIPYRAIFCLMIIPGALFNLELVWKISDITNGMMAFPNLIGLIGLSTVVLHETRQFLVLLEKERESLNWNIG